jgi:hypothetical protein
MIWEPSRKANQISGGQSTVELILHLHLGGGVEIYPVEHEKGKKEAQAETPGFRISEENIMRLKN